MQQSAAVLGWIDVYSTKRNTCPKGFSCQFSQTAQQNICCGRPGGSTNPMSSSSSGSLRSITSIAGRMNVCEKGQAYLLNGVPQQCTSTRCPVGYECVFSKKAKNYFCCSKTYAGVLCIASISVFFRRLLLLPEIFFHPFPRGFRSRLRSIHFRTFLSLTKPNVTSSLEILRPRISIYR